MKKLEEYDTPETEKTMAILESLGFKEKGWYATGKLAEHSRDLERKLAMCRDALRDVLDFKSEILQGYATAIGCAGHESPVRKAELLVKERDELRAEVERAEIKTAAEYEAHKMTKCERDALRSKVERLETLYEAMKREKNDYQAQRDNIRLEADQLSTELHLERFSLKEMNAEVKRLKADKARLDWLIDCGSNEFFEALSEYSAQARVAIDAAMKETK